jgi:hypothetical protein
MQACSSIFRAGYSGSLAVFVSMESGLAGQNGVFSCLAAQYDVAHESMYQSLRAALASATLKWPAATTQDTPLQKLSCCALQAGMWIGIAAGALLDGGMHGAVGLDADAKADDADAELDDTDMPPDADGDGRRKATEVGVSRGVRAIFYQVRKFVLLHTVIDPVSVCTTG